MAGQAGCFDLDERCRALPATGDALERLARAVDFELFRARPARLTAEEKAVIRDGGTPVGWSLARRAQIDRDARWTLKRGRKRPSPEGSQQQAVEIGMPIFGYKSHMGIDRVHGLIRNWTVAHAAAHDGGQLTSLLDVDSIAAGVPPPSPDGGRFADGSIASCDRWAYRSTVNLAALATRAMVPQLQRPKPRGKPMPPNVRRGNARRGKVRAAVEHVFACPKRRLRPVVRTVGMARVRTRLGLADLVHNLLRFTWLEGEAAPTWADQRAEPALSRPRSQPRSHTATHRRRLPNHHEPPSQPKKIVRLFEVFGKPVQVAR